MKAMGKQMGHKSAQDSFAAVVVLVWCENIPIKAK
jgi:hypothetical protein